MAYIDIYSLKTVLTTAELDATSYQRRLRPASHNNELFQNLVY